MDTNRQPSASLRDIINSDSILLDNRTRSRNNRNNHNNNTKQTAFPRTPVTDSPIPELTTPAVTPPIPITSPILPSPTEVAIQQLLAAITVTNSTVAALSLKVNDMQTPSPTSSRSSLDARLPPPFFSSVRQCHTLSHFNALF